MRIDLHAHTTCSDGTQSPTELVAAARAAALDVVAITDHDTMAGSFVARDYLERFPELAEQLEIVPGVEISSRDGHILGL